MSNHIIRPITAAEVRPLRQRVLRPHKTLEELVYPGDDHPLALHAGAFQDGTLVGIATVAPESCPVDPQAVGWRLRGMAILPQVQRQGYGAALIAACAAHIVTNRGELIWCHGRVSALPFYQSLGFASHGEEFLIPVTGPHYLLWKRLVHFVLNDHGG